MTTTSEATARATNILYRHDLVARPGKTRDAKAAVVRSNVTAIVGGMSVFGAALFALSSLLWFSTGMTAPGFAFAGLTGALLIVFLAAFLVGAPADAFTEKHTRDLKPLYKVLDVDLDRRTDEAVWKAAGLAIKLQLVDDRADALRSHRVRTPEQQAQLEELDRKARRLEARIAQTLGVKLA